MDIRLMGNVEIHNGARPVPLSRAGERCVLASLALDVGHRVHVDTLIDRLWGDDPPTGAVDTIASYIRTVRKAIEAAGGRREWLLNRRPAAYELAIDPGLVDYHRFTALVRQARAKERDGAQADAVRLYQEALTLRTAAALSNLTGQWAENRRYAIEQHYLETLCARYAQQLAIGDYAAVATSGTHVVMEVVPTDRLIALTMYGLAGSGQHAAITGFLTRATKRMWDTAQARPGREIFATARQLVANPHAPLPRHTSLTDGPPDEHDGDPGADPDSTAASSGGAGHIVMIAEHNQRVYQAAGDQYLYPAP